MESLLQPWKFLLPILAGWINGRQQEAIDYLLTENRVLREKLGKKRILLNDDQRRRLAIKGKILGACPRIRICRVPSAAWADARRRDAGNAGTLSRSANEADAPAAGLLRRPRSAGTLWAQDAQRDCYHRNSRNNPSVASGTRCPGRQAW
jgi:hypothetical protein